MKKDIFINPNASIKDALKKLDKTAEKTLLVVDDDKHLLGTITDGDIRRFIIKTGKLEGNIKDIFNSNPIKIHIKERYEREKIKKIFLLNKIEVIPVVDDEGQVVEYLTWTQFFSDKRIAGERGILNIPCVIMAGGKGTRLTPFTQVLPKPLIPVGEKTMVEHIIDNFKKFRISKFFLTLNYKGEVIQSYFNSIKKDYEIEFIWEKKFLGTAGSLKLLEGKISGDFIISNCDVLIKANFKDIYKFHKENNSTFTSVVAIQHYKIPYGIVKTGENGKIEDIREKPEYIFQINTGVYIANERILKYIPEDEYFDMPNLIKKLIENNESVFAYPINESDYIDIGQWEEYRKNLKILQKWIEDV